MSPVYTTELPNDHEDTGAIGQARTDSRQARAHLLIGDKLLKRVSGHHDQIELPVVTDSQKITVRPLNIEQMTLAGIEHPPQFNTRHRSHNP